MQYFPAALQDLADQFARLPGIGGKTAQRLAFHVLELPLEDAQSFADAIVEAKRTVHSCPVCQNLTDREVCPICDDDMRDHSVICVVAEPKDVISGNFGRCRPEHLGSAGQSRQSAANRCPAPGRRSVRLKRGSFIASCGLRHQGAS